MTYLPTSPGAGGEDLAVYLAADPDRQRVFEQIRARLETTGRIGDHARFYVVQRPFRRAVLRGSIIAVRERIPDWAKDHSKAKADNRAFMDRHREAYRAFLRDAGLAHSEVSCDA